LQQVECVRQLAEGASSQVWSTALQQVLCVRQIAAGASSKVWQTASQQLMPLVHSVHIAAACQLLLHTVTHAHNPMWSVMKSDPVRMQSVNVTAGQAGGIAAPLWHVLLFKSTHHKE
jgi:hypothetical protein